MLLEIIARIGEIPRVESVCMMDILHSAYRGISINAVDIWSISVNVAKIRTTGPKWLKLSKLNCYHLKSICVKINSIPSHL